MHIVSPHGYLYESWWCPHFLLLFVLIYSIVLYAHCYYCSCIKLIMVVPTTMIIISSLWRVSFKKHEILSHTKPMTSSSYGGVCYPILFFYNFILSLTSFLLSMGVVIFSTLMILTYILSFSIISSMKTSVQYIEIDIIDLYLKCSLWYIFYVCLCQLFFP